VFRRVHEGWLLDANHPRIFQECLFVFRRVLLHGHAVARGVANDFVINVGDIHDVANCVTTLTKKSPQKIDRNKGSEISNMSVVVDRRSAGIHANFGVAQWAELLDLRRHCVEETKGHVEFECETNLRDELMILGVAGNTGQIVGSRK